MDQNGRAIVLLCSQLCADSNLKPLTTSLWGKLVLLLLRDKLEPKDLFDFTVDDFSTRFGLSPTEALRYRMLLDRGGVIALEQGELEAKGISIITRADSAYPSRLKHKLKNNAPPLFYVAGNLKLLEAPAIGFVGSRKVEETDVDFTKEIVRKINGNGFVVVSGGAKGIDSVAREAVLDCGGCGIEFLADSMLRRIRTKETVHALKEERILLLSAQKPDAGFHVGVAMGRNKFIYAQSEATVVVKSDFGTGGTWAGAVEALKNEFSPVLCWENTNSQGNMELIAQGAVAIDSSWSGSLDDLPFVPEQLSF